MNTFLGDLCACLAWLLWHGQWQECIVLPSAFIELEMAFEGCMDESQCSILWVWSAHLTWQRLRFWLEKGRQTQCRVSLFCLLSMPRVAGSSVPVLWQSSSSEDSFKLNPTGLGKSAPRCLAFQVTIKAQWTTVLWNRRCICMHSILVEEVSLMKMLVKRRIETLAVDASKVLALPKMRATTDSLIQIKTWL